MHIYRLSSLSGACHKEGKEDQLDELHLETQHQSWSRDMLSGRQISLPDGLLDQLKLCRYFSFLSQLLRCGQSLPKAFRAILDS